ncbi:sensor histidine kinase [Aliiglaciecola lipolytica]|uniref:histidine kinase n=1 Tax=Aliiglaciecola lipolytica E3 TaxID=1127673 RepID=K6X0P8_9ALTE|nr:HAMP domain-containing sensor histidine kinase [Aliiglaciecola lipolytica]GAC14249.1 two-component system, OmpR family, sensor histidine kinase BasS [Aliiglaciecola lipolytica E3]
MTQATTKFHSLSSRIIWRFCLFTLFISAIYALISLSLMYNLEDSFIERGVKQEADYLSQSYATTGNWPAPRNARMQLAFSVDELPTDIRALVIEEPRRKEFFGNHGLHYHLYRFKDHPNTFLVAEVSEQLLVRPIRGGIIQFLVGSGVIVTVIACLIAWLIGRRTARPLSQLASLVDGVALDTLPRNFANDFPKNEVGILANALDHTLERIASAMERERSFTRDVSHELRTPLAVIKNAVEVAQLNASKAENQPLQRIYQAAEQMEKTVQTLLVLAREEYSVLNAQQIDLLPILERAILDNHLLLENKAIEVEIDDSCKVQVLAEPNVLKVILDNIIGNAFKYTLEGQVMISFADQVLLLSDTGPGIQANISATVTDRGVKGEQSTGLGFGLSIVKRLCEHQGWQLEVRSTSGTEVRLRFNS